ncbi:chromodomain-helicase-DNA-binding protein 7-like [Nerophis ophidion]|nr:chromodomain-helicase-DNA-binding protein 7-like [Nerophis ophidion]
MFDRLLTGPVVREEGVRRRGRRPKSEIAKAAAQVAAAQAAQATAASSAGGGINPLLLNSLFGGMDLSLQSLQLAAGLMAFPAPTDPKQAASMLPLMLPAMGALPNMFGLGGLFQSNLASNSASASTSASASANTNGTADGEAEDGSASKRKEEDKDGGEEVEEEEADDGNEGKNIAKKKKSQKEDEEEAEKSQSNMPDSDPAAINSDAAALLAAAGMSANSLAFNPFLLSTMAPGLLYPSMFLPPGLGGLGLPGFPSTSTLADLQSAIGVLGGNALAANPNRDNNNDDAAGQQAVAQEEEEEEEEEEARGAEGDLTEERAAATETRSQESLVEEAGPSPHQD